MAQEMFLCSIHSNFWPKSTLASSTGSTYILDGVGDLQRSSRTILLEKEGTKPIPYPWRDNDPSWSSGCILRTWAQLGQTYYTTGTSSCTAQVFWWLFAGCSPRLWGQNEPGTLLARNTRTEALSLCVHFCSSVNDRGVMMWQCLCLTGETQTRNWQRGCLEVRRMQKVNPSLSAAGSHMNKSMISQELLKLILNTMFPFCKHCLLGVYLQGIFPVLVAHPQAHEEPWWWDSTRGHLCIITEWQNHKSPEWRGLEGTLKPT